MVAPRYHMRHCDVTSKFQSFNGPQPTSRLLGEWVISWVFIRYFGPLALFQLCTRFLKGPRFLFWLRRDSITRDVPLPQFNLN